MILVKTKTGCILRMRRRGEGYMLAIAFIKQMLLI